MIRLLHVVAFAVLALALDMLTFAGPAYAQSFNHVYAGSDLYCVKFPNGKKDLVINQDGDFRLISVNQAAKPIASELSKLRSDQRELNALINDAKSNGISGAALTKGQAFYSGMQLLVYGAIVDPTGLPATEAGQLQKLRQLQRAVAQKIAKDGKNISAIENYTKHCKKGPGDYEVKVVAIKLNQFRTLVGAIYYTYYPYSKSVSACLQIGKKPGQTMLGTYNLTPNPCVLGGFDCTNQLTHGEVGYFHLAVDDATSPSQETVNGEIDAVEADFANGLYSCGQ